MTKKTYHLKKVAMVAYAFPPLNYSGTERPFQFAKHLPEFGYLPYILSQDNYINYHIVANDAEKLEQLNPKTIVYRLKTIKSQIEEILVIRWLDGKLKKITGKVNIMSRVLFLPFKWSLGSYEWELRTLIKIIKLKFTKNLELIWVTAPSWHNLMVGYWGSKITGLPFIVDLRDPLSYGVLWKPKSSAEARKILNRQYKYLKQASKIIFTSPLTEKIYLSKYEDILKGKTNSITNGFDEDIFIKKHKYLKSDKFIISYIGRLTKGVRDPNFFLHGFDLACENQEFASKVTLRMIGYMHDFIEELEAANKYYNIEITNVVPRDKSLEMMTESDVLIIIQSISGEGADVISGKLFEYLNASKYIIGVVDEDGGDSWLIKQTDCGVVTGIKKPEQVSKALLSAFKLWKNKQLYSYPSRDYKQFRRRHLTESLAQVLDDVLKAN